jgi:hypothetical protein
MMSSASTLEEKRDCTRCQYSASPQPTMRTSAASRNDESSGAASPAPRMKMPRLRRLSSRNVPGTKLRTSPAPISASLQLLTNQPRTIAVGTPLCSSTARCAGSAAASSHHQFRVGASSSTATSSAFGGHSVEVGCGLRVKVKPRCAAR